MCKSFFFQKLNSSFWNKTVDIHLLHSMPLEIHQLAMRPLLTHNVRSVVPLLLAPLQHPWLRPLDLLLSDAIQVPVYLFPQNTNCLPETAWSPSTERFPKGFPTLSIIIASLAEVVGQLSDCYSPHYTDSRPQLSSRFHEGECYASKPPTVICGTPWLSR